MSADKLSARELARRLEDHAATHEIIFGKQFRSEEERQAAAELRRIPALEAERDQLRAEVDALRDDRENARELARPVCEALNIPILHDAPRAIEALRADAERYRHLTTSMGPHTTLCYDGKECIGKTEFDAVIDAARKQQ